MNTPTALSVRLRHPRPRLAPWPDRLSEYDVAEHLADPAPFDGALDGLVRFRDAFRCDDRGRWHVLAPGGWQQAATLAEVQYGLREALCQEVDALHLVLAVAGRSRERAAFEDRYCFGEKGCDCDADAPRHERGPRPALNVDWTADAMRFVSAARDFSSNTGRARRVLVAASGIPGLRLAPEDLRAAAGTPEAFLAALPRGSRARVRRSDLWRAYLRSTSAPVRQRVLFDLAAAAFGPARKVNGEFVFSGVALPATAGGRNE